MQTVIKDTVVDSITGEIISEKERRIRVNVENNREYIKIYTDVISALAIKLSDTEKSLLLILGQYIENDTGKVVIDNERKLKISDELGVSINAVNSYLSRLAKKEILIRKARGSYYVNPLYVWKGSEEKNVEAIEILIKMIEK